MDKEIFKKLKNHKLALINKKNIKNGRMNIKLNKINKPSELNNTSPITKIKSKSTNKLKAKIVNGMNKFPTIKLPINKNRNKLLINDNDKIGNTTMNNLKLKKYLQKEETSITKIRLKTNNSFNLKNFHSTQNSKKLLLPKTRDTSYNIKRSENYLKTNNINLKTHQNVGLTRILDRKKLKENKSIILPKHNFKLLKENKITNNNHNKSRDKFKLNINNRKLNNLFEFDKNEKKINSIFSRSNLKTEINEVNKNGIKNIVDIISDISLSEEELNFSEEDSIDNMEFSLDDEEI
jgi:hypothetical protein